VDESKLHDLAALVGDDEAIAKSIIEAARVSMGRDISENDLDQIRSFAT
jgi:nucleolar protein 56